jgi:Flp pilus assembly protein TadD
MARDVARAYNDCRRGSRKARQVTRVASGIVQRGFADALRHHQAGRLDEAIAGYRRVIDRGATVPEVHFNLGVALGRLGRLDEAAECYQRAIALKPDYLAAHNNLGNARKAAGQIDAAIASYRTVCDLTPRLPQAHFNLGNALKLRGSLSEAIDAYRAALAIDPDYVDAHNNLAMALLARGDFAAGWREWEWRWRGPILKDRRDFSQPQWLGQAGEGRALLIHAEQGFGDTLQFCRFAPLAAARGWRVMMEVQPALLRLIRGMPGVELVVARGEPLPPFDFHCPMMSMPLALGITPPTLPAEIPYLRADTAHVASWRARLAAIGGAGPRIGLVWAGNSYSHAPSLAAVDRRRSLDPALLAPLFAVPGVNFVSLQKGQSPPPTFPVADFMTEMSDFADTGALVSTLDLVISVDTAVVHLAGALGTPVWVLNRFDSCWRWLAERDDSPWYPKLRLYRQPRPGDWNAVIAAVVRDLREFATA